ncbi:MAG: acyl carrier protein [Archangium sp.]|nr:acyl carrier protein [Archangium sp.]
MSSDFSEDTLKKVLGTVLDIAPESITDATSQDNVETWDSLRHLTLILALEEQFGISFPDEEAANLSSYQLVRLVVKELLAAKG